MLSLQKFTKNFDHFAQNKYINPDLNEEEKALLMLQREDVDQLRLIAEIPKNNELYQFKLQQYKEHATQKQEIQKIILEQRLQKLKYHAQIQDTREQQTEQTREWINSHRKNIINQVFTQQRNN